MDKELDIIDRKRKEKDFNKIYLKKRILDEEKERKYLNEQNNILKKNKEYENKRKEHIDKVENIYQNKHSSVINEYIDILKKDVERNKILEKRKEEFAHKKQIENEKRDRCLMNFKNINKVVEEQKEIRSHFIKNKKKEREEKEERNIILKNLNEDAKREKEKRLLEQFEINEENVRRRKSLNEKLQEDKKYRNYIKYDSITSKYMEQKNILIEIKRDERKRFIN